MLSFDYTADLQLEDTLRHIDQIRTRILTHPLPPASELKLQWEGTTIRCWATLALAGHNIPKHHVATILAHPGRPTRATATLTHIRAAYDSIHASWRANPKPISFNSLQALFATDPHMLPTDFTRLESEISELLEYISQEKAHPVIQAAIAHIHLLTLGNPADTGISARLTHYLLLAKYGYDVRGFATPERVWLSDARTYFRLMEDYRSSHHLNPWLSYIAESMRRSLELLVSDIESDRFHIEFPQVFWKLTDRQKEIARVLSTPQTTITNKQVQKRFRVSQITASRDLSRLAALGILYPHGKGRSVYYSKI